ncbi:MAG: FAD-dependent oxidoreductase [Chloroflexi bacterium]|nr:FAD-dependent oxidoreductase [Chloroflexota bacterium]MCL5075268.1 FAD-dependent oxidoreductase [Chloroflexota bacterium]
MRFEERSLQTDVLVLGGGLAGCMAAIKASEYPLDVTLVEKCKPERSGCAATGLDHFWTLPPDRGVTAEQLIRQYAENVEYLVDQEVLHTIVTESFERVKDLETWGVNMRAANGEYRWVGEPFIHPFDLSIHFAGHNIKRVLAEEARKRKVRVLERSMATRLLTDKGRVIGALVFNHRQNCFTVIQSKAVVITTGGATRIYHTPSGRPFSTFAAPSDTGDGFAMAFHAGAELTCMEFSEGTAAPKSFRPGTIGNFTYVGGKLVNVKGEPFAKTHLRFKFAANFLREIEEGNGPLFVDTSGIADENWKWVEMGLGSEVPMFLEYLKQSGLFRKATRLAVGITEYDLRDGRSGLIIDRYGRASLPGLYAAGDAMGGVAEAGMPGAITMGWKAGEGAATYASNVAHGQIDPQQVSAERRRLETPLQRQEGLRWTEVQGLLQQIMSEQVERPRTESGLRYALRKVEELTEVANHRLIARDSHEAYRTAEVQSLLDVARMCIVASLERKESRHLPYFERREYPARNDENWLKFVVLQKDGEGIRVTQRPIPIIYGRS